ncbi:MAG: hypothetical protein PHO91_01150 [Patescibacteria group bacterium]|nr:hypothetical protein [Patescibacteria group bacterium]
MILILSVTKKNKAAWILEKEAGAKLSRFDFELKQDSGGCLLYLDDFFKKEKIDLTKISGLIFLLLESGLTQAKVLTAILNTLAWQLSVPIAADFYYQGSYQQALVKAKKDLAAKKSFAPISAQYKQAVDITFSKKKRNYKIIA